MTFPSDIIHELGLFHYFSALANKSLKLFKSPTCAIQLFLACKLMPPNWGVYHCVGKTLGSQCFSAACKSFNHNLRSEKSSLWYNWLAIILVFHRHMTTHHQFSSSLTWDTFIVSFSLGQKAGLDFCSGSYKAAVKMLARAGLSNPLPCTRGCWQNSLLCSCRTQRWLASSRPVGCLSFRLL